MAPPKRIKLSEVPSYVDEKYDIEVSRQTVYNWAKTGIHGIRLKTVKKAGRLLTTAGWVDEFVNDTGAS